MEFRWIVFGAVLVINAVSALLIIGFIVRKFEVAGRNALGLLLASLAVWSFAYAMITFSTEIETKKFWLKLENIGILTQPVFWIAFVLGYSRHGRPLKRLFLAVLGVIPAVSLGMIFSDNWFHLYYASIEPLQEGMGPLVIERGHWYWAALIQAYALNVTGTMILIWRFVQFRNIFRRQLAILSAAALIPLAVNILYQMISNFLPSFVLPIDLTPISFTVSIGLISSGIFHTRLLDLVPIARDVVMEQIPEMVFVVDAHDRVLDVNTVAERWLGKTRQAIIGHDPMEIFGTYPQLFNRFLTTERTREEVLIPGDPPLFLEVIITPLYDGQADKLSGRVVLAYDITKRKQLENELKKSNESLEAKVVEIESLRVQLQEQAIRDSLTGVFNRRFLSESLDLAVAKAAREKLPISIIMMDVDHFKSFNDTHGHKCGDAVLRDLADFLTQNSRQGDVVCRYGGEEFVIIMPDASLQDCHSRADAWRQIYSSRPINFDGKSLNVTFSAGVACFPLHGSSGESILHAADHALYKSKSNGRNRVTIYDGNNHFHRLEN